MTTQGSARGDGGHASQPVEDQGTAWPLMTPAEVAGVLHVDPNTLARWSRDGKLTAVRTPGGHRRYLRSEVLSLARPRRSWPSSPRWTSQG